MACPMRVWLLVISSVVAAYLAWTSSLFGGGALGMSDGEDDSDVESGETASDDGEKTYLNCPFDDKDECKALGGRWDGDAKKWYVPAGKDTAPFAKWL